MIDYASPQTPGTDKTSLDVQVRLSVMMFLEFFIWGAWYVTCGNYMAAHAMTDSIYWAYTVGPFAAIISPFFLGIVADRFFASEAVLGVLHLVGGGAMFCAAAAGAGGHSSLFIFLLLIHMLAYMPTLGLTNAIALSKLARPDKQFPLIRVFGTLGWIVANLVVSKIFKADDGAAQFYITGIAAVGLGLFSFVLPHTPAPARGQPVSARSILGLDSLSLLKSPPFAVFIISSFLICVPLSFYYAYAPVYVAFAGFKSPAAVMSLGQVSEWFFMMVMPLFFGLLGIRWMLLVGMLAWVVRYSFFAAAIPFDSHALIIVGILLHGMSYDFFFVAGSIYVEQTASPAIRGQAQGFLILVTQGAGMLIGAQLSGLLFNHMIQRTDHNLRVAWHNFWLVPAAAALIVAIIFFLLFRETTAPAISSEPVPAPS